MAIRYCGDVEIRIQYEERDFYIVAIRAPQERGLIRVKYSALFRNVRSSETYDAVARKALMKVLEETTLPLEIDGRGTILIRRVFQSPCPL